MLFDAKTKISLIKNLKLSELGILRRSDEYSTTFFYCLSFNIYVVRCNQFRRSRLLESDI